MSPHSARLLHVLIFLCAFHMTRWFTDAESISFLVGYGLAWAVAKRQPAAHGPRCRVVSLLCLSAIGYARHGGQAAAWLAVFVAVAPRAMLWWPPKGSGQTAAFDRLEAWVLAGDNAAMLARRIAEKPVEPESATDVDRLFGVLRQHQPGEKTHYQFLMFLRKGAVPDNAMERAQAIWARVAAAGPEAACVSAAPAPSTAPSALPAPPRGQAAAFDRLEAWVLAGDNAAMLAGRIAERPVEPETATDLDRLLGVLRQHQP